MNSKLSQPVLHEVELLHAWLGHIAPTVMRAVVRTSLRAGTSATISDINMQLSQVSYSVCSRVASRLFMHMTIHG